MRYHALIDGREVGDWKLARHDDLILAIRKLVLAQNNEYGEVYDDDGNLLWSVGVNLWKPDPVAYYRDGEPVLVIAGGMPMGRELIETGTTDIATWTNPGTGFVKAEGWGGGGGGGGVNVNGGGGGGGGEYRRVNAGALAAADTLALDAGANGGLGQTGFDTIITRNPGATVIVRAKGGLLGVDGTALNHGAGGAGGTAGTGDVGFNGGAGGGPATGINVNGGGGGGSGGSTGAGGVGGAAPGAGGTAGTPDGGGGGAGANAATAATLGTVPGAGGGGASTLAAASAGRGGQWRLTYTLTEHWGQTTKLQAVNRASRW